MDIISHYSAYTPASTSAAIQTGTTTPGVGCLGTDEFLKMIREQGVKAPDRSEFPSGGSESSVRLSDTEIAVLANKYDPCNMDQETYDDFLDGLQGMGVISDLEKRQLGYNGFQLIAYADKDGNTVKCGSGNGVWNLPDSEDGLMCMVAPWEADTDLHKWLGKRTQKELVGVFDPSDREPAEAYEGLLKRVFSVVDRMAVRRDEDAEKEKKKELVRQLADGNSDFYSNLRTQMKAQVEKNDADRKEQAVIDALAAVLDAMSGREDASGNKTSVNKSVSELTQRIGERIHELEPDDPERVRLEQMLKRLQEMGIYFDLSGTDGLWQDEKENFETLTQFLIRRQAEEISTTHPITNEVNQPE